MISLEAGFLGSSLMACVPRQSDDVVHRFQRPGRRIPADPAFDVRGPTFQGSAPLGQKLAFIINARDTRPRTRDVVHDLLDNVPRHANFNEACDEAAAQIVQTPGLDHCIRAALLSR